jgi:D-alanyl-D-alanine carboxypeptidase
VFARAAKARRTGRQTGEGFGLRGSVAIARRYVFGQGRIARLLLALPVCLALAAMPVTEALSAQKKKKPAPVQPSMAACIVVDMNTGSVLHAQSADVLRHPASLTKMMTLYVLFGYMRARTITPNTELTVNAHAASQAPTKLGLKPGATLKTSDAIKALVTKSANDAATVVAENISGSEEAFARLMTDTARRIGMKNTTFRNASGLPDDQQISTARDMAILSVRLIKDYPEYYEVFATRNFTFKGQQHRNHNRLLANYGGTDGIKTGYTRASGFNLAASVKRDDKHLVAVVLGGNTAAGRDAAMRAILDKQFPNASTKKAPPAKGLIASLHGPSSSPAAEAPLPPVRKPDAPAAAPAVPAATTPPAQKKPATVLAAATPGFAPAASSEGDIGDPSDALRSKQARGKPLRFEGDFHVQVGAFMSQAEAENRLGAVHQRAVDLLDGHLPFTASFMKDDKEWFRARFAGFSNADAQTTCAALKKRSLDCVVMTSD